MDRWNQVDILIVLIILVLFGLYFSDHSEYSY